MTQNNPIDHVTGLNENNQLFTLTYRVTDNDGDTADGTLMIDIDDDTPMVSSTTTTLLANGTSTVSVTEADGVFEHSVSETNLLAATAGTSGWSPSRVCRVPTWASPSPQAPAT